MIFFKLWPHHHIAGGHSIQDDSDAYVRTHGPVKDGEVAVTAPGNLPCKVLVHAVGPIWNRGFSGEKGLLSMCVSNILRKTDTEKCSSVAIPALSAGVFGFPMDESTTCIVETVKHYFTSHSTSGIKEVHLIDNNIRGAQSFAISLQNEFGKGVSKGAHASSPIPRKPSCRYKYYFKICVYLILA